MSTPPWGQEPGPDPVEPPPPPYQAYGAPSSYDPPSPYGAPSHYGAPSPYGAFQPTPPTNGLAIASLVVSILGAVALCCYGVGGILGAVGAILGHVSKKQIRDRNEGGGGVALAGIIVGWIAFGLGVLAVAAIVVLVVWTDGFTDCYYDSDGDYVCT